MPRSIQASNLGDALARITEQAAIAAEAMVGRGDEQSADLAATQAMKRALGDLHVRGRAVMGDADVLHDYESVLPAGLEFGPEGAPEYDFVMDPLEGATIAAKSKANAISVMAAAPRGGLLATPDIYMDKLAIGPGHAIGVVDLDAPAGENAMRLAQSKGVDVSEITACVLDRPRHDKIIADLRRAGARVNLIGDGDVAAVINAALSDSGIDMYVGEGGAPEGVLAAAALRCVGGQFLGRLVFRSNTDRRLAEEAGLDDPDRTYTVEDLASGDVVFAATGVTRGGLLEGVVRTATSFHTHSIVMAAADGVVRRIRSEIPRSLVQAGWND